MIKALDRKITQLPTPYRLAATVGVVIAVIIVPVLVAGLIMRHFEPPKPEPKSLAETMAHADKVLAKGNEDMRAAIAFILRKHGMSDVEINNWFAACDQQAQALKVLKGREMAVRGTSSETVEAFMQQPTYIDTSLSQCRLPGN